MDGMKGGHRRIHAYVSLKQKSVKPILVENRYSNTIRKGALR